MTQEVTVLSKTACGQCMGAKMFLKAKGVPFKEIQGDESRDRVIEMGFGSFPVIIPPEGHGEPFAGNQPVKLAEMAKSMGYEV